VRDGHFRTPLDASARAYLCTVDVTSKASSIDKTLGLNGTKLARKKGMTFFFRFAR
jgi:hypothetical protein